MPKIGDKCRIIKNNGYDEAVVGKEFNILSIDGYEYETDIFRGGAKNKHLWLREEHFVLADENTEKNTIQKASCGFNGFSVGDKVKWKGKIHKIYYFTSPKWCVIDYENGLNGEEKISDIVIDYKKQLQEKDIEIKNRIVDIEKFQALKSTEIKAAEQAVREKYEKSILELTEKVAVAEARIKEKETISATAMKVLEDYSKVITDENKALRAILSEIAKEKAHVVTPTATPAQMVVVKADGTPTQIIK